MSMSVSRASRIESQLIGRIDSAKRGRHEPVEEALEYERTPRRVFRNGDFTVHHDDPQTAVSVASPKPVRRIVSKAPARKVEAKAAPEPEPIIQPLPRVADSRPETPVPVVVAIPIVTPKPAEDQKVLSELKARSIAALRQIDAGMSEEFHQETHAHFIEQMSPEYPEMTLVDLYRRHAENVEERVEEELERARFLAEEAARTEPQKLSVEDLLARYSSSTPQFTQNTPTVPFKLEPSRPAGPKPMSRKKAKQLKEKRKAVTAPATVAITPAPAQVDQFAHLRAPLQKRCAKLHQKTTVVLKGSSAKRWPRLSTVDALRAAIGTADQVQLDEFTRLMGELEEQSNHLKGPKLMLQDELREKLVGLHSSAFYRIKSPWLVERNIMRVENAHDNNRSNLKWWIENPSSLAELHEARKVVDQLVHKSEELKREAARRGW